jgi:hypothetical protein
MNTQTNPLVPHEMRLSDFINHATVQPLVNHGRRFEVFFDGKSMGFCDSNSPICEAHAREVNNALYANTKHGHEFMGKTTMPPQEVLDGYPDICAKFPELFKK